jgi:hypothetical protein
MVEICTIFMKRCTEVLRRTVTGKAFRRETPAVVLERRQFMRVKSHFTVSCDYINDRRSCWGGTLVDISEGGMRLQCPEPVRSRDIARFVIHFDPWNYNVTVAAGVVWTTLSAPGESGCVAGFSFLDVDVPAREFIRKYVRALSK